MGIKCDNIVDLVVKDISSLPVTQGRAKILVGCSV